MNAYPCPCCGHLVFDEPPGSYDICQICFWEDDISQLRFVTTTGANHVSLLDAQRNFRDFGAAEQRVKPFVRFANAGDRLEPGWRLVDSTLGEEYEGSRDYGETYPHDATVLYYWRDTYWRKRVV